MKKPIGIFSWVFTALLLMNFYALSQTKSYDKKRIKLKDGSRLVGRITEVVPGEKMVVVLTNGMKMDVYQEQLKKITNAPSFDRVERFGSEDGEVIFLNDGSRIFGHIVMHQPGDFVTITNPSNGEQTFFDEEIAKIVYNHKPLKQYDVKRKGFFHQTDIGLLMGNHSNHAFLEPNFSIHMINGYKIKRWLNVGFGFGLDYQQAFRIIPFYGSVSGELSDKKITPIYFLNLGTSTANLRGNTGFQTISQINAGRFFHIGGGYKFRLPKHAFNFKIGYKTHNVNWFVESFPDWLGRPTTMSDIERQYRNFNISFGIEF